MNAPRITIAALAATVIGAPALADYTITQGTSAPQYTDHTLTFDEPGTPTGVVSPDAFAAYGITELQAGDGVPVVDDFDAAYGGWGLGDGNSFFGNFGVFMTLDSPTNAMSLQVWDPSGPPSLFGGGLNVLLFNDGELVGDITGGDPFGEIATPAWGGVGDSWFNMVATDGDVFDEVRILGYGFIPTTFVDNLSWTRTPAPGSLALILLAGLTGTRRRR